MQARQGAAINKMYGPDEILQRAARSYPAYLRSVIAGEKFFPLVIPFGKTAIRDTDFATLRREIAALKETPAKFTVEWVEKIDRRWGRQQFPAKVYFATAPDFLSSIGKIREAERFVQNLQLTRSVCPEMEGWLGGNALKIVENGDIWPDILKVCRYFLDNPRPNRFVRELPIATDTKFIERNEAIIANLLKHLIPDSVDLQARSFEKKFGLLFDPPLIRFRVLDQALRPRLGLVFTDLSVPADEFAQWKADGVSVVITENKMNFLTLPRLPNTIGIWGGGNAASLLSAVSWLKSCQVIYWGDIDVSGFEILSRLRETFPKTQTVLMDEATLERFVHLALPGKGCRTDATLNLNLAERAALNKVMSENLLLEQEKLPGEVSKRALEALVLKCASAEPARGSNDTHPATETLLLEGYRKMTSIQKIERVRALTFAIQELALLDIRRRYPEADITEQSLRLASRWIPPELMLRAFGWDSREAGY